MLNIKDPKFTLKLISFWLIFSMANTLQAKTKSYQVEILVFETFDEAALAQSWPLKPGKPSILNAIHIDADKQEHFSPLAENDLKLGVPKQKIEKSYHLILHKGWRQTVSDSNKEGTFGVHVTGGVRYSKPQHNQNQNQNENQTAPLNESQVAYPQDQFEVEGIITLTQARQLNIHTDLVFRKPMILISKNGQMGKFAQIPDTQNGENTPNIMLQAFRLTDSSPVILSDMHYIDHPLYGVIILVTSEKSEDLS